MEPSSKSRRKTFTVEAPSGEAVLFPFLPSNEACNRTFISEGGRELHNNKNEMRLPLPDSSMMTGVRGNQSMVLPGPLTLTNQRTKAPPPMAEPSVSSSTNLFPFLTPYSGTDEFVRKMTTRIAANSGKLNGLLPDNGISSTLDASGGELFETTTVEPPKKKPGLVLEQLRLKEKALLDKVNNVTSSTAMYEKEQKAAVEKVTSDCADIRKKVDELTKQNKKIKAKTETLTQTSEEVSNELKDIQFQVDLKNEFLRKFVKVGEDYKCTDMQFCKKFHKGGTCFAKPTS